MATRVRTTSDQNVSSNADVIWQDDSGAGCFNDGEWASGSPTILSASVVTDELWSISCLIDFVQATSLNYSFHFDFSSSTCGLSTTSVAVPIAFTGAIGKFQGATIGEAQAWTMDLKIVSDGTLAVTVRLGTEGGPFPVTVRGPGSFFTIAKIA